MNEFTNTEVKVSATREAARTQYYLLYKFNEKNEEYEKIGKYDEHSKFTITAEDYDYNLKVTGKSTTNGFDTRISRSQLIRTDDKIEVRFDDFPTNDGDFNVLIVTFKFKEI